VVDHEAHSVTVVAADVVGLDRRREAVDLDRRDGTTGKADARLALDLVARDQHQAVHAPTQERGDPTPLGVQVVVGGVHEHVDPGAPERPARLLGKRREEWILEVGDDQPDGVAPALS